MKRILFMVLRNLIFVPYGWFKLCYYARHVEKYTEEEKYAMLKYRPAGKLGGRITIDAHGVENIPQKRRFCFLSKSSGTLRCAGDYGALPQTFSASYEKEVANVPFLKQVFACMKAIALDREDVRQAIG